MKTITVDGLTLHVDRLKRVPLIYVSGPLTTGHVPSNVRCALDVAHELMQLGYAVIVPHEKVLSMEMLHPMPYIDWLRYDFQCILSCDAVYRMPGASRGASLEVRFARSRGIPVFTKLAELTKRMPIE
jgi:hypothetical protein